MYNYVVVQFYPWFFPSVLNSLSHITIPLNKGRVVQSYQDQQNEILQSNSPPSVRDDLGIILYAHHFHKKSVSLEYQFCLQPETILGVKSLYCITLSIVITLLCFPQQSLASTPFSCVSLCHCCLVTNQHLNNYIINKL